jgi:imidazolonepropionase-like amidohydrolase
MGCQCKAGYLASSPHFGQTPSLEPSTGQGSTMKTCARLCGLLVMLGGALAAAADGKVIVVRAGHMIDTDAGRDIGGQSILIRDGLIVAVAPKIEVPVGARLVDLGDYTVLPGLMDAHTHLTIDYNDQDPLGELKHTAAERALGSLPNARAVLLAGFTTVRDLGPYRALVDVALRDAINRGDVIGPRMYVAGAYLTITGGAGAVTGFAPDVALPWDLRFGNANSPTEVRERVRALAGHRRHPHPQQQSAGARGDRGGTGRRRR